MLIIIIIKFLGFLDNYKKILYKKYLRFVLNFPKKLKD